jgi:hypothetical protein
LTIKNLKAMSKIEKAVKAMKELDFSPRFINSIPPHGHGWFFRVDRSIVNAKIDFGERLERTTSHIYGCGGGYYLPHFRKRRDVNLIYENDFFAIYSKKYNSPTHSRKYKSPIGMIVQERRIIATFACDYESDPKITKTKIDSEGQCLDIIFLSFLDKRETIAVICIDNRPKAFTGLPFAVCSADGNKVLLQDGHEATLSIEMPLEHAKFSIVFSF